MRYIHTIVAGENSLETEPDGSTPLITKFAIGWHDSEAMKIL
jgi:hypothetical protein